MELLDRPLEDLCAEARALRDEGHGSLVTYSPKVFIPLTKLCRDVCHYCTFAHPPRRGERAYMSIDEALEIARAGVAAGCREALFTLGDKPELRYRVARDELAALGCETTLEYLARCARLVLEEAGLLPHLNPGVLSVGDSGALRRVSASQGLVLGADWNIQAPPNLSYADFPMLLDAGINDWGGVSPVTVDHVNPEAPWPELERLGEATRSRGLELAPRLAVYPEYVAELERWVDPDVAPHVLALADSEGLAREDEWAAGAAADGKRAPEAAAPLDGPPILLPAASVTRKSAPVGNGSAPKVSQPVAEALAKVREGVELDEDDVPELFRARGTDFRAVTDAADALRREVCGDSVTYVVTRNINYTNVCYFRCGFCAFSKGKLAANLRG